MNSLYNLTPIFEAVIALCAAVLSAFAVPWLFTRWDAEKLEKLLKYVKIAVAAAEQTGWNWTGKEKKTLARSFLREQGFKVDTVAVDKAIEAAVLQLHNQIYTYFDDGDDGKETDNDDA